MSKKNTPIKANNKDTDIVRKTVSIKIGIRNKIFIETNPFIMEQNTIIIANSNTCENRTARTDA